MKYKVGDVVKITCEIYGHDFNDGEIVKIIIVDKNAGCCKYFAKSIDRDESWTWWIGDDECVPVKHSGSIV